MKGTKKMFDKNLYITKGIDNSLPKNVVNLIWFLLKQDSKKRQMDYLQVFELKTINTNSGNALSIHWSQEQPEYSTTIFFPDITEKLDIKVWVICTGEGTEDEYSTMLLPEEY